MKRKFFFLLLAFLLLGRPVCADQQQDGLAAVKDGDPVRAFWLFQPLNRTGKLTDPEAQYDLAWEYSNAAGDVYLASVAREGADPEKLREAAVRNLREKMQLEADAGDAKAQFYLGVMNDTLMGDLVMPDRAKARAWYRKAAAQGNADAQLRLALMDDQERVIKRNQPARVDDATACAFYRKLKPWTKPSLPERLFVFAIGIFYSGAVDRDARGCELSFTLVDRDENVPAPAPAPVPVSVPPPPLPPGPYVDGGDAYNRRDYQTAYKIWRPLADQGDKRAQLMVAQMYAQGQGVKQDFAEAYFWYSVAAKDSVPNVGAGGAAAAARPPIMAKLTPDQIAGLDQIVAAWKPTKVPPAGAPAVKP